MRVRRLDPRDKRDYYQFWSLPFSIYRETPQWVPPLEGEMRLVFDRRRHPFYRHSEADFFIAESEGQVLGRIAVLHQRNYSQTHHKQTGFFYYFESIDDRQVSAGLFDAALDWARTRGLEVMIGPKGFLRSSGIGLLVEGFEHPPALGIPYNPPYYEDLVTSQGFEKLTDHLSGYLTRENRLPVRLHEMVEKVKKRGGFWIKTFNSKAEMRAWAPRIEEIHRLAFQNNPGYYPSTKEEFSLMAANMIRVADPHLVKLIMKGDEVAGFMIAYANISAAIRRCGGRLFPLGWLYILAEFRRARWVDLNGLGLLPAYQGLGGNILLYSEVEETLLRSRFDFAEIVQVDEQNFKSRADMENMGVHWHKCHRTYQLAL